jgi:hypothetical protein
MARRDWSAKLDRATFRCTLPRHVPRRYRISSTTIPKIRHPFRYFAQLPGLRRGERAAGLVGARADGWRTRLRPGPVTAEGKAAAAKNLEGHPTPQESRLTRFNAMKHGMEARTATYFPAKPDKYAFCEGCDVDTPGAPRSRRA